MSIFDMAKMWPGSDLDPVLKLIQPDFAMHNTRKSGHISTYVHEEIRFNSWVASEEANRRAG
jgi:hypothetical protein